MYQLICNLDLELLRYLDLNRQACEHIFLGEYHPIDYDTLSPLDQEATDYALDLMLRYIKPITIVYFTQQKEALHKRNAEAAVIAEIEEAKAKDALAAVDDSIKRNADILPKETKTFKSTVKFIIDEHTKKPHQPHTKGPTKPPPKRKPTTDNTNHRPHKRHKQQHKPNQKHLNASAGEEVHSTGQRPKGHQRNTDSGNPNPHRNTQPHNAAQNPRRHQRPTHGGNNRGQKHHGRPQNKRNRNNHP
jgi:hypothetical protein